MKLREEQIKEVFESVQSTFAIHPKECLKHEQMWADASEKANSVTRDQVSNILCVTVYVYERGALQLHYGLPETSPVLLNSRFYQMIMSELKPHLAAMANR